jgi:hypothetical protein
LLLSPSFFRVFFYLPLHPHPHHCHHCHICRLGAPALFLPRDLPQREEEEEEEKGAAVVGLVGLVKICPKKETTTMTTATRAVGY